jgi:hypothetical protein
LAAKYNGFTYNDERLLTKLQIAGLIEELENGTLHCASCNTLLNASNIGYVTSEDSLGKGIATCQNPSCISKARSWMDISFEKPNDKSR